MSEFHPARSAIGDRLRTGGQVSDDEFDALFALKWRRVSSDYWTPIDVASTAAEWLTETGIRRVVDVGSGMGKFCLVGALRTGAEFVGIEQRRSLVRAASHASVRSFNDCPWITWDRDQGSFAPARCVAQHAPKAEVVLRTSHFASQLVAAASGLGVGLFPTIYLRPSRLVLLRYDEVLAAAPVNDLWLVGHRIMRDVPRVAAVWTFLADSLRAATRERDARHFARRQARDRLD